MEWRLPWKQSHSIFYSLGFGRTFPRGHRLFRKRLKELGRRIDCDDVLYSIKNETPKVAVVHLTYRVETDPKWPTTQIYESLEDFFEKRLIPDAKEYVGE